MICELLTIGAVTLSPCDIEKLEVSISRPESRCIVVDKRGERRYAHMKCLDVVKILNSQNDNEKESEWEI